MSKSYKNIGLINMYSFKPRAQPILRFFFRTFFGEAKPATFFSENVVREWQEQRGSM